MNEKALGDPWRQVLRNISIARRNRAWEAREILELLDDFEWPSPGDRNRG